MSLQPSNCLKTTICLELKGILPEAAINHKTSNNMVLLLCVEASVCHLSMPICLGLCFVSLDICSVLQQSSAMHSRLPPAVYSPHLPQWPCYTCKEMISARQNRCRRADLDLIFAQPQDFFAAAF